MVGAPTSDDADLEADPLPSLVNGEYVIPIRNLSSGKLDALTFVCGPRVFDGAVPIVHAVDLAFSVTFHKIQGLTLPKVILDLEKRTHKPPQTFEMIYVRTRCSYNHI